MKRTLAALAVLLCVVLTGLVQGRWTDRWHASPDHGVAAERLADVPRTVGDWQGHDLELDAEQLRQAGLSGYVLRRYENRISGQSVTVLLVCGRPGPVSVHTPDVCYAGLGYQMQGERKRLEVPAGPAAAAFWSATFGKPRSAVGRLRILWAWSAGGPWEAAGNPRLAYGRARALYKLYVVRELSASEEAAENGPSVEFLRRLLPELEGSLFTR